MKKLLLLFFLFNTCEQVFSQITTLSDAELGFAVQVAEPTGDLKNTQKTGFGGSAKFAFTIPHTSIAPSFESGLISFSGKEITNRAGLKQNYAAITVIPAKFGGRYTTDFGMYVEPQLGTSLFLSEDSLGNPTHSFGFTYALNLGYQTLPGFDISIRYENNHFSNGEIPFMGIRVGYHFTFRRQEIY